MWTGWAVIPCEADLTTAEIWAQDRRVRGDHTDTGGRGGPEDGSSGELVMSPQAKDAVLPGDTRTGTHRLGWEGARPPTL